MSAMESARTPALLAVGSAIVSRASFMAAVAAAARVAEKRNTIPILSNLMIRAADDGVVVTATDLDLTFHASAPGAVDPWFACTVPAHKLLDVLKKAKASDEIEITGRGDSVVLDFAGLKVTLQALPVSDFPTDPKVEWLHRFTLRTAELARLFGKTAFAVSSEAVRYYLNGVFLHPVVTPNGSTLTAVATDGHRLSRIRSPLPLGAGDMPGVIVPTKSVAEILRLVTAKGAPDTVAVRVSNSRVEMDIGTVTVNTKTVDGTFPDYARVMPREHAHSAVMGMTDLRNGVEQVLVVADTKGRAVRLTPHADRIQATCTTPEGNSATMDVSALHSDEPFPAEWGMNGRYILDTIDHLEGDVVTIAGNDPGSPFTFTGSDPDHAIVVMPMRV